MIHRATKMLNEEKMDPGGVTPAAISKAIAIAIDFNETSRSGEEVSFMRGFQACNFEE